MECYEGKEREYLFPIIKTCENCGSEFEGKPYTQRCLCDKCYKNYRKMKSRLCMRMLRDEIC